MSRRKKVMSTRHLINEIKSSTSLNTIESAILLEAMLIKEESPISTLYTYAGDAMWDTVKIMLAERIIEAFGYGDHKDGLIAIGVKRWVASIQWSQIQKYFSGWEEGGCEMWINSLLDTLTETFAEWTLNKIIDGMKSEVDKGSPVKSKDSGMMGIDMIGVNNAFTDFMGGLTIDNITKIAGTFIREQLFNTLFPEETRDQVTADICDAMSEFSVSDLGGNAFSDITSRITSMVGLDDEE